MQLRVANALVVNICEQDTQKTDPEKNIDIELLSFISREKETATNSDFLDVKTISNVISSVFRKEAEVKLHEVESTCLLLHEALESVKVEASTQAQPFIADFFSPQQLGSKQEYGRILNAFVSSSVEKSLQVEAFSDKIYELTDKINSEIGENRHFKDSL